MDAARADWYRWAQEQGMYITQAELAALMRGSSAEALLVIDVRDDDNGGGSIRGAVHCPEGSFCAADGRLPAWQLRNALIGETGSCRLSLGGAGSCWTGFHAQIGDHPCCQGLVFRSHHWQSIDP